MTTTEESIADKKLTASEAADLLDVSTQTVTRMINRGVLSAEKVGAGQTERWQIPLTEVVREMSREGITSDLLRGQLADYMSWYYRALQDVLDQAEQVKALRDEQYAWESGESVSGEALDHFDKLDSAVCELRQRITALNALRGGYLMIMRAAGNRSELTGEEAEE